MVASRTLSPDTRGRASTTTPVSLTDEQRAAAFAPDGPLLVVAGPGSGKTRLLVARIVHLVRDRQVSPAAILVLTFASRAAQELRACLVAESPAAGQVEVSTFHALGLRIVRHWHARLGLPGAPRVCTQADRLALVRAVASDMHGDVADPELLAGLLDRLRLGGAVEDAALLATLAASYERALLREGLIDYAAMLLLPLRLFQEHPASLRVLQLAYRHVLVDELQDVCPAQYLVARRLAAVHRNFTAVGDPDQRIYGWRGADGRTMRAFAADFPDVRLVALSQNFRSTGSIVALAEVLRGHRESMPRLWTANPVGPVPELRVVADDRAEAELVAAEAAQLLAEGVARRPSEVAVLSRTRAQAGPFRLALARVGLARSQVEYEDHDRAADPEQVRLLTAHAAKGAEWPVVFVTGLEEGLWPHALALGDGGDASVDDERRVLYVAVTRARARLYLSGCRKRSHTDASSAPTSPVVTRPSRFLRELLDAGVVGA